MPLLPTKQEEDTGFDEFDGASFTGAVFNLSTTIVGAGIMALPATMKALGLVLGIAMIIFMAFLTEASIEMLLRFSRVGQSTSYGGVMGDAFGKFGKIALQICVLVNNVGVLSVHDYHRRRALWNNFKWSSPCWCARRVVRSVLVE